MPYYFINIKGCHNIEAKNPGQALQKAIKQAYPGLKGYRWNIIRYSARWDKSYAANERLYFLECPDMEYAVFSKKYGREIKLKILGHVPRNLVKKF